MTTTKKYKAEDKLANRQKKKKKKLTDLGTDYEQTLTATRWALRLSNF